jgi:hypothetical protein
MMRWASDNGEQHDQCASLARTPSCLPDSPHLARDLDRPRTQPGLPPTPRTGQTCPLLASKDARARINFQQLCARPGPPAHPRATITCTGPVRTESSKTSLRPPVHPTVLAPTPRTGKHMRATCQQRRARSDPLPANCARPGPPTHPRATSMHCASENREQHDRSASLPRTQPCLPPTPRTGKHKRATCKQGRARSDPLPATLRATWTTHAPTRHHYALGQ